MQFVFSTSNEDRKKTLINLQWLIVLATAYLLLFQKGEAVKDPRSFSLKRYLSRFTPPGGDREETDSESPNSRL